MDLPGNYASYIIIGNKCGHCNVPMHGNHMNISIFNEMLLSQLAYGTPFCVIILRDPKYNAYIYSYLYEYPVVGRLQYRLQNRR